MTKNHDLSFVLKKLEPIVDQSYIAAAAKKGNQLYVRCLFAYGHDVNQKESEKYFHRTALFYAVFNNDIPMVKLLLQFGANSNITDQLNTKLDTGKTPLEYAMTRTKNIDMVKVLVEQGHANINRILSKKIFDNSTKKIVDYIKDTVKWQQVRKVHGHKKPTIFLRKHQHTL